MNRYLTLALLLLLRTATANGQCTADYSYTGTTDTLAFTNLSSVSNAHFYWNFGDGSGSNEVSPTHIFPDDGKYLVTLYGVDTLSNCVDVKESWIDVVKPDTLECYVYFTDTIIGSSPQTTNLSSNCSGFNLGCHVYATAQNLCNGFTIGSWGSSLFLHGMQATTSDNIYGYRIYNAYYETFPYNYSSANNYQNCSANFEYVIDYQPDYAEVTFTAMNKNATNYTFYITGFGNPILLDGYTVSFQYDYTSYKKAAPKNVTLITTDDINNCSDTITQTVLIINPNYSWPVNCAIYAPIESQVAETGATVQFYISASSDANYQWQQDAGLGYVDLTNAGPYSGVTTNTLTIANVQEIMNNYQYRCVVYDSLGGCHNISSPAALSVPVGINDFEPMSLKLYPNPASNYLNIDLPNDVTNATLTIHSILGQRILSTMIKQSQTIIDLNGWTNGMYLVEVSAGNRAGRQLFFKQD